MIAIRLLHPFREDLSCESNFDMRNEVLNCSAESTEVVLQISNVCDLEKVIVDLGCRVPVALFDCPDYPNLHSKVVHLN